MERELDDVESLSNDDLNEMEERRISRLNEAGVDEKKVLHEAGEEMNSWGSYFNENIVRGKDDMNFCLRDQWTAIERSEFSRLFKVAMTFNKLYDNVKKIAGEQRKNKPDLLVRSLTGKATEQQIDLRADLVRTISYQSQNDLAYQTAFRSALMGGFGALQVFIDYENPRSFRKIIRFGVIPDPTMCAWDPTALKPHKGDGNFVSRRYVMTRDEFFATYPYVTNPVSFVDPTLVLDTQWQTRDTIIINEHFKKEWFPLKIYKLSNGMVVDEGEWEKLQKEFSETRKIIRDSITETIMEKEMPRVVDERQTQDYRLMQYHMIRNQIIDFSEFPSRHLPIPFVDGDSYFIEGRQYTRSFIHEARDAQKLLNYARSETATELKNRRREQWLATPDNIVGNEQQWRNPEVQQGALIAKPDPKTGMMPQKMNAWEVAQGLFVTAQSATQDMKEILGFSESEALEGRDISGKARRERKTEGSMSAYVYFDNLNQAIEQAGRVVLDLLPYVYGDEERHVVISKKDGKTNNVLLNKQNPDGTIENELNKGDYDIEIDTGPSFSVQKDIALEFFQQTIAASQDPQVFNLIADLWAKNLDVQFMPQIAERLQNLVPPQILAKEQGKQLPPQPPSPQEQMMQMEMQNKQQELVERAKKLELEEKKHELDKMRLVMEMQDLQQEGGLAHLKYGAEVEKSHMDYTAQIAKILADHHSNSIKKPA